MKKFQPEKRKKPSRWKESATEGILDKIIQWRLIFKKKNGHDPAKNTTIKPCAGTDKDLPAEGKKPERTQDQRSVPFAETRLSANKAASFLPGQRGCTWNPHPYLGR